jgi:hypothetical protein
MMEQKLLGFNALNFLRKVMIVMNFSRVFLKRQIKMFQEGLIMFFHLNSPR